MNYGVATADGGMLAHKGETMNENRFFVGARGRDEIVIMMPPLKPISKDDAINLAALLPPTP